MTPIEDHWSLGLGVELLKFHSVWSVQFTVGSRIYSVTLWRTKP